MEVRSGEERRCRVEMRRRGVRAERKELTCTPTLGNYVSILWPQAGAGINGAEKRQEKFN